MFGGGSRHFGLLLKSTSDPDSYQPSPHDLCCKYAVAVLELCNDIACNDTKFAKSSHEREQACMFDIPDKDCLLLYLLSMRNLLFQVWESNSA